MFYRQKVTGIYTVARACARAQNPFCKNVNKSCSLKSVLVSILPEQPLTLTYRTYYNAHKKPFFFFCLFKFRWAKSLIFEVNGMTITSLIRLF